MKNLQFRKLITRHLISYTLSVNDVYLIAIVISITSAFYALKTGMWKQKLEAVLFLWKGKWKRENCTASASTSVI